MVVHSWAFLGQISVPHTGWKPALIADIADKHPPVASSANVNADGFGRLHFSCACLTVNASRHVLNSWVRNARSTGKSSLGAVLRRVSLGKFSAAMLAPMILSSGAVFLFVAEDTFATFGAVLVRNRTCLRIRPTSSGARSPSDSRPAS